MISTHNLQDVKASEKFQHNVDVYEIRFTQS